MRAPLLISFVLLVSCSFLPRECLGEQPRPVSLATHIQTQRQPAVDVKAIERIRKIVLHQGENPRALANLVQLTRDLDAETAAQLFSDIADDYLRQGKYNQGANFLQQLLNQHHAQRAARDGLLKLMRLYSSSEVNRTQQVNSSSADDQQGFCRYALHIAGDTLQKTTPLNNEPAVSFQRAVTARGANRSQISKSLLTRLKHDADAGPWRACARVEQWLREDRKTKPPKPVTICRRATGRPYLDGALIDPLWQSAEPMQLTYDDEFLYLAIRYPKIAGTAYATDPRPRAHDADLAAHDHVRLWLDLDRDYATCFELAVDHRGWTADRCWYDTSWNPQWFVASGGDDSTWIVEAAIPWEQLTDLPPQSGHAWAVAFERETPSADPQIARFSTTAVPPVKSFRILLFE